MATPIRPENLPAVPVLSGTDALIVDTGAGVYRTTPEEIVGAGGALLPAVLAAPSGSSLSGWRQSGSDPEDRTAEAKLRERISNSDYAGATLSVPLSNAIAEAVARGGGVVYINAGNYTVTSQVDLSALGLHRPLHIICDDNATITSSYAGYIFNDTSQAVRIDGGRWIGPGIGVSGSGLFKGRLAYGWIRGIKAYGFDKAVDITSSIGARIQDNWFSDCNYGLWCDSATVPNPAVDYANLLIVTSNWFNACRVGFYATNVYGLIYDGNESENNGLTLDFSTVREISGRVNWFEQASDAHPGWVGKGYRIGTGCTGSFENSHFSNNANGNTEIDYANCTFVEGTTPLFCVVKRNTTQTIPHNVSTAINWDSETTDPAGMHSTSVNPSRINILSNGLYAVAANFEMAAVATGTRVTLTITINGTAYRSVTVPIINGVATANSISFTELLGSGTYVDAQIYQDCGAGLDVIGGTVSGMSVRLIAMM